ncbi:DUF4157 domain-containing protein [Hymenobacter sp. BT664]|uniref:DUF4157 domain-containing protein n=1 Tax=Hymenobacter montanus TaxID=2771359 RepID=A0A927GHR4_9BACT|nr:DUF4157 domain-containing protein [Hymenobacter montanus]MBD2766359.1 DUF4157 domain-containing protein [Hymenobacter montanus]
MKASAEKSSTTTSTPAARTPSPPFFAKAGGGAGRFFEPASAAPPIQTKLTVNQPGDKFEQEADRMADKIMRMPAPAASNERLQRRPDDKLQKKEDDKLQREAGTGTPAVGAGTQAAIRQKTTGGHPLSADVRRYMEPRFGADFSQVRIHHDAEAASLSNQLSARAFTYQNHVFFARNQYQPATNEGKQLLAHELTHTIQQGHAIQRSPQVSTTATPPPIQRLGVQDALDYFAEQAYHIPGFRLLTIVLGFNPINRRSTDRNAANLLRALIEVMPGGHLITQALDNHGVFSRAGAWVEAQLATLGDIGRDIVAGFRQFMDSLGWREILNLGGVWNRARNIFLPPIARLMSFGLSAVSGLLGLVKAAIMRPLAALAQGTRGYDLLKALLGQDPITSEPVPRSPDTLLGGFMRLIGQEEVWENLKRGHAVARAWAWFQGALAGLLAFARSIPQRIVNTLTSLTLAEVVTVAGAFTRVGSSFANIATEFFSWAVNQVISLLEILFSVVAPGAMPFVRRAGAAFQQILRNPVGFVGNLVRAGVQGFRRFSGNILTHLRAGLVGWLTGALAGLTLPAQWNFRGILSLVLQVLGLTWQNVRGRLVRVLGERTVAVLETTFSLVMTLVREGPAAAWRELMQHLGNLREMLFGQIRSWVQTTIVTQAVTRIASMLNPAGAVIQAIIAIYNTIMFFVERMRQIGAVAESVVNSMSAIAAGSIGPAANAVEQTMARLVPVVISLFARLIGLGGISEQVQGVIRRIQQPVNNAIDRVVDWIVAQARRLVRGVVQAGVPQDPNERLRLGMQAALGAVNRFGGRRVGAAVLAPLLGTIKVRYGFTTLEPFEQRGRWWVRGRINPSSESVSDAEPESAASSEDIMQRVKQEIQAGPEEVNSSSVAGLFDNLMATYGQRGLRSLELRVQSEQIATIVGSASPETILAYVVANQLPLPDYGAVTAVIAIDDTVRGNFRNRDGRHAEEGIIALATQLINQQTAFGIIPKKVEILVSQSPCLQICTPQLIELRRNYLQTRFALYYNTLYQGTEGLQTENSLAAIRRLRNGGWNVRIWNGGRITTGIRKSK